MKIEFKKAILLLLPLGLLVATNAFGGLTVTLYQNSYSYGVGGEFTAVTSDPSLLNNYSSLAKVSNSHGTGFETFCIEYNIEFNPGVTYNAAINGGAIPGGGGVTPGSGDGVHSGYDPISIGTAWLYSQFAGGTLAGYDYLNTANRKADAGLLQTAFWYLENEINSISPSNPFYALVMDKYGSVAAAEANSDGQYGVAALNLTDGNGGYHQSQLVQTASVPEPSTVVAGALLLLPLGMSAFRVLRNKQISQTQFSLARAATSDFAARK